MTDTKAGGLHEDIEATRARIEGLRSELGRAEKRLADLRGVEQKQLEDQVASYERMTPDERMRLREESPSAFGAIMDALREKGEAALYAK